VSVPVPLRRAARSAPADLMRALLDRPPEEIRLHLGLHKTATTHIQETLAALAPRLAAMGVDAPATTALRGAGFPRAVPAGPAARARARGRMARLRGGGRVLVLSDERWLSGIPGALAPDPYPDPERQLAPVLPLLRAAPRLRLLVALRDMGTHLPSAYAESLRFFPDTPPFAEAVAARLAAGASWLPAIERLRALFPEAPLTLWRYEGYRGRARAVLAEICGADPGPLPELAVPRATRSPRAADVAAVEATTGPGAAGAGGTGGDAARRAHARRMREALDGGREGPRFALEDAAARAAFSARYAADLEALGAMRGVRLLGLD
jgi:hypothetical protein